MKTRTLVLFCTVIACLLSAGSASAGWTEVPVLVNVQKGVTPAPTDAEIAAMVAEANKLLKQAEIKLMFDKNKSIKRDFVTPGHANGGDNKIDADEDEKLDPAGVTELEKHTGEKGEGTKIVITNEIHGDPNTLGLAMHDPKSPVIYVKWPQTAVKGGNTTAHEFGHVYTLGKNHLVDDKNTSDPSDDDRADDNSHASPSGNLMHATENGTKLTEDQIKELQKGVKGHGHAVTWLDRAWRWTKRQFDSQTVAPTILSSGLMLGSELPDPAALSMHTSFGGGTEVGESMAIAMGMDTDNNPLTGRTLTRPDGSVMEGVDRTLLINIEGDPDLGGIVEASLLDEIGAEIRPMTVEFEHILKMVDNDTTPDDTYRAYDQVRVEFDQDELLALNVASPDIPVEFFSYDGAGDPAFASDPLLVNLVDPILPGPAVFLSDEEAQPGDLITLDGIEFFPDATDILIQFDDADAGMVPQAGPQGAFNGMFQVPPDAENGMYFITASTMDPIGGEQMQYAFAMLQVTPEPGTMILLSAGALAVLRKRRLNR
ncbi:MAG: PEP-CTERM sorting domain-containing protein [Phycisphaerales bacterium]|jgi:hypothetical protein|nr:PEP-CTERM sorting domain-containing protein [Phycisphaerales bacterium]